MARISFTKTLARHIECPPQEVPAGTLREVLEAAFEHLPELRGYLLDDRGHCRQHVAIFVNGRQTADREALTEPVPADGEVFVMQALSGG